MNYSTRILVMTGMCLVPIIALFGWILYRRIKKNNEKNRIDNVIIGALNYESEGNHKVKKSLDTKITEFWSKLLKPAGVVEPTSDDRKNVMKIIMWVSGLFLVTFLFTLNVMIALLPGIILIIGLIIYCKQKINAQERLIKEQIPSFLSALKSNIQSNETPERALVSAIDATAEPLYGELKIVKSLIETGTFETALSALRKRTNNEYLIFLCSCIELSTEVGANLEEQIVVIEKMIQDRQALTRKMDSAVAENMPILYVAGAAIPFLFIYMYFTNEQVRAFWFHSLLSWVVFFLIFIVCGIGGWAGNKVIKSVRNM